MKIEGLKSNTDYIRPFYIGDKAGPPQNRYVLWVDVMGAGPKMERNVKNASIPIMKLHVAALTCLEKNKGTPIELYPIIDGIYVVSQDLSPLMFFISFVFKSMATEFLVLNNWERSLIRGAISYGPVILGRETKLGADIFQRSNYCSSILLGMPLVQAYNAERQAPPFGIFVHESARAFAPSGTTPITTVLWQWWHEDHDAQKVALKLLEGLKEYFKWCSEHTITIGYPKDRIVVHELLAEEYLKDVEATIKYREEKNKNKNEKKFQSNSKK